MRRSWNAEEVFQQDLPFSAQGEVNDAAHARLISVFTFTI
jgi:hypothetical protein